MVRRAHSSCAPNTIYRAHNFLPYSSLSVKKAMHCKDTVPKIRKNIPRNETARLRSQFLHSCICTVSGSICIFCCSKIGGPIEGIYKSFTDTWMRTLGTRLRSFISRNTQIGSSLQCGRASLNASTPRIAWSHTGRNLHGVSIFGSEFGEKSGELA